jgi:hypothetical protein
MSKQFIELNQWGQASEYFLVCGEDGIIRVKDGRNLEDYINSPELVKIRKSKARNHGNQIMIPADTYERISIPQCA